MKVIIAGSRTIQDYRHVRDAIVASGWAGDIAEVVSGGAKGPDQLAEQWAERMGIPVTRFIPKWKQRDGTPDRRAGFVRNTKMAMYGDALIAVWDGKSRGTGHMIKIAEIYGRQVYVHKVEG